MMLGMTARIHLRGAQGYRLRGAAELSRSILEVSARQALNGPRLASWSWFVEVATQVLKRQTLATLRMDHVKEARRREHKAGRERPLCSPCQKQGADVVLET